jgi:hypothetical protein
MLLLSLGCLKPTACVVYRALSHLPQGLWDDFKAKMEGDTLVFNNFNSTSTNKAASEGFLGDDTSSNLRVFLTIDCIQGFAIEQYSAFPAEQEVLLTPGSLFCVKKCSISGSRVDMHIMQLSPPLAVKEALGISIDDCSLANSAALHAKGARARPDALAGVEMGLLQHAGRKLVVHPAEAEEDVPCSEGGAALQAATKEAAGQEAAAEKVAGRGVELEAMQEKMQSNLHVGAKAQPRPEATATTAVEVAHTQVMVEDAGGSQCCAGIVQDGNISGKYTVSNQHIYVVSHGAKYRIKVVNGFTVRAGVEIEIDGHYVGGWVLGPKEQMIIERPCSIAKSFTFLQASYAAKAELQATEFAPAQNGDC